MAKRPDYAELVAQAENAVASVKDPDLRRVAFQKVLDDLLGSHVPARAPIGAVRKSTAGEPSRARKPWKRGTQLYVEELVNDGFFKKPKTIAQVKAELENRGHHIALTSLSGPLQKLCQRRKLRRQKLKTSGKKQTFAYSNW